MRVAVVVAVPPDTTKHEEWRDGFTEAIKLLSVKHDVRLLNIHPESPNRSAAIRELIDVSSRDILLVKSNWSWLVDCTVRKLLNPMNERSVLLVSGVSRPPDARAMSYYDVLVYETDWYRRFIAAHPRTIHGFGVDTSVMNSIGVSRRDVDWLSVGRIVSYKRHEVLAGLSGVRVVVGESTSADPEIVGRLKSAGVRVLPFTKYEELARWYQRAKNVVVNCTIMGGGERAVLEARACGAAVYVSSDNVKLIALASGPVYDERYYATSLDNAIDAASASRSSPSIGWNAALRSRIVHAMAVRESSFRSKRLVKR